MLQLFLQEVASLLPSISFVGQECYLLSNPYSRCWGLVAREIPIQGWPCCSFTTLVLTVEGQKKLKTPYKLLEHFVFHIPDSQSTLQM